MPVDFFHTLIGLAYFALWVLIANVSAERRTRGQDGGVIKHTP